MKTSRHKNKIRIAALAAFLAAFGLAPQAHAQLNLSYEEDFGTNMAGDAFAGQFRINLQNFDMAALYAPMGAPGTAAGYGENGTGPQTVEGGINTLNGMQASGATGAQPTPTYIDGVAQPASTGMDDIWGIARIISITDLDGGVVWSEAVKNQQLTVMFYGGKDFYVNQLANGFQEYNSVGLGVDLWLQNTNEVGFTAYNPFLGSAGRTGINSYTSVTDGAMVLSTISTGGFIHDDGTLGGLATEFSSVFNSTAGGTGQMYLNITGGTEADKFDTNLFTSPYVPGATADLFAQFTTVPNTSTGDWLVRSNDPVTGGFTPVPEPSTYGMVAALSLMGITALRRRKAARLAAA